MNRIHLILAVTMIAGATWLCTGVDRSPADQRTSAFTGKVSSFESDRAISTKIHQMQKEIDALKFDVNDLQRDVRQLRTELEALERKRHLRTKE